MFALVKPTFVSTAKSQDSSNQEPLKELEVVDIYKQQAGNIVTSYTEQTEKTEGFLDKLKNAFSLGGLKDTIKDASSLLKTASQGASALAALKSGSISGLAGGLSSVARMAGVGGIVSTIAKGAQIASIASGNGSIVNKAMNLANASGFNTSPLTRLVGNSMSVMNGAGGLSSALGGNSNLSSLLSTAGRFTDTASGFLTSVEGVTGMDYKKALGQVGDFYTGQLSNITKTTAALTGKVSGGVENVISSLTGTAFSDLDSTPIYTKDPQGAASLVAGVTLASVNSGVMGSFTKIASQVKDVNLIKNASLPLLDIVSKSGSLNLATEIYAANETAGSTQALFSVKSPAMASNLCKNLTFDGSTKDTDLAQARNDLIGLVGNLDPNWNKATVKGTSVMSAQSTKDNPYMGELFFAGVNTSKQATAFSTGTGATKPIVTDDAFYVAAGNFSSDDTKDFTSDKVLTDLW